MNLGITCTPCLSESELLTYPDLVKWNQETENQVIENWKQNGHFNSKLYDRIKDQRKEKIAC